MDTTSSRPEQTARRAPAWALWATLGALVVVYAVYETAATGSSGTPELVKQALDDILVWAAAAACFAGALRSTRSQVAWFLVSAALASWAVGDTIWSLRFAGDVHAPVTSISDVFWLAWYPLILAALVLLVRDRVPRFELHRWIDGVAVMLIVATPWVALFLQPVAAHSTASSFADAVDFAYPLGDAVVVGAALGAFALMGWRPGRMWLALGTGLCAIALADAIYSVEILQQSYRGGVFDAAWLGGAVLIAYAAWCPHPGRVEPRRLTGWQAIALPLAAQFVAISIQFYGIFAEIPSIERGLTIVVLLIAVVQIVVTRPDPKSEVAAPTTSAAD